MTLNTAADNPIKRNKRGRPSSNDPISAENSSKRLNDFSNEDEGTYAYEYKQRRKNFNKFKMFDYDMKKVMTALKQAGLDAKIKGMCGNTWFTSINEFRNKFNETDLNFNSDTRIADNNIEIFDNDIP